MKSFIADKKYLLFPIAMDAPCKTVAIWTKNEKYMNLTFLSERAVLLIGFNTMLR